MLSFCSGELDIAFFLKITAPLCHPPAWAVNQTCSHHTHTEDQSATRSGNTLECGVFVFVCVNDNLYHQTVDVHEEYTDLLQDGWT